MGHQFGNELLCLVLLLLLGTLNCVAGLRCLECLSLTCESPVVCESIFQSMRDPLFYPKSFHIEFQPNVTCPPTLASNKSSKAWTSLSQECPIGDSACLEATIEVITTFNGLVNGSQLDPYSELSSVGYIRACASRKYLKSRPDRTITYKDDAITNSTLMNIATRLGKQTAKGGYTVKTIHSHEFYIDHGTEDSVTCYQDNCNDSTRRNSRNAGAGTSANNHNYGVLFAVLTLVRLSSL